MISSMRNNMESNLYKYVLWILLFSLVGGSAFVSIVNFFFPKKDPSIYATVNGFSITRRAIGQAIAQEEQQVRMLKRMYGFDLSEQLKSMGSPEARAFNTLTNNALIQSAAKKAGLRYFSQEQLVSALASPDFLMQVLGAQLGTQVYDESGNIRWDIVDALLRQQGMSMDDFERMLAETLQKNIVLALAGHAFYIPHIALKELYLQTFVDRSFAYAQFPFNTYLKKAQKEGATEKQLQAFYREQNTASRRYWAPEKRAGLVWEFDPSAYNLRVTDKDVQLYYTRNRARYMQNPAVYTVKSLHFGSDAYDVAQEVVQKLTSAPESFDTLFAQYKGIDGTVSAQSGAAEGIVKATEGLARDGDFSALVETKDGWEIVKRIARKAPVYKKLDSVRNEVEKSLRAEKFQRRFVLDAGMVGKQAKRDEKALERFVSSKKAQKTLLPLTNGMVKDDTRRFVKELFGLRRNGMKAFVDQKGYLVILTQKEDAHRLPYKDVAQRVKKDYFEQQARVAMNKDITQAQKQLESGSSLADVAKKFGVAVKNIEKITGQETELWQKFAKDGLPVAHMRTAVHVGDSVVSLGAQKQAGCLAVVSSVAKIDNADVRAKKDELMQQIEQEGMRLYIDGFIASLKENATIEVYKQMTR